MGQTAGEGLKNFGATWGVLAASGRAKPGHYGSSLEIDHIVSLELGGSNDIAILFPSRYPTLTVVSQSQVG